MVKFKVGDRVKIVRKVEDKWIWTSSGEMDLTLGKEGDIVDVGHPHCQVSVEGGDGVTTWTYDNECLELVVDRPKELCFLESELLNAVDNHKREIEKLEDMLTCIKLMNKHQVKLTFEEKI
ncbi:MAG: hypothetical protein ACRC0G_08230 [Fusobacteriaceae bacterium]